MFGKIKEWSQIDGKINIIMFLIVTAFVIVEPANIMVMIVEGKTIPVLAIISLLFVIYWIKNIDYLKMMISSGPKIFTLIMLMIVVTDYSELISFLARNF